MPEAHPYPFLRRVQPPPPLENKLVVVWVSAGTSADPQQGYDRAVVGVAGHAARLPIGTHCGDCKGATIRFPGGGGGLQFFLNE